MNISIIIPALDERGGLPGTVAQAVRVLPGAEVIVADGGSRDGTREWVQSQPTLRLVDARRGRGPQMNAGAQAATSEVLLFLHADCLLPPEAGDAIAKSLADPALLGGAFGVRFPAPCPASFHRLAGLITLRSRLAGEATGDQAIFVRRASFEAIGGFPEWPLFEDFALVSRLKQWGGRGRRFRLVRAFVVISPRRWQAHGLWRASALMCALYLGYKAGVAPATLKRWFVDVRPADVRPQAR